MLDADEMLDASAGERIRIAIERPHVAAFHNWRWNYVRDSQHAAGLSNGQTESGADRGVAALSGVCSAAHHAAFSQPSGGVLRGLRARDGDTAVAALQLTHEFADFIVHHFGHAEDAELERQRKNDLYQLLGERKLKANADDPQALIETGHGRARKCAAPGGGARSL